MILYIVSEYDIISIHAPRTGSDATQDAIRRLNGEFQSTLPARGATALFHWAEAQSATFQSTLPARGATVSRIASSAFSRISIHAPRTGSDKSMRKHQASERHFNPRSPHGERRSAGHLPARLQRFQSTLPARGATYVGSHSAAYSAFQSTLPARGATA